MNEPLVVHGLDLSYFTGKVECYLRAKGIRFRLVEMDTRDFERCAKATGVRQMPQIEMPGGEWLTDSTLIIRYFEQRIAAPSFTPADPAKRFVAHLLEDTGDETLWRPALYYRWAFADDARLMSARLAHGMLRDVKLPFFIRRLLIKTRQQRTYLRKDGVTAATSPAIERLYLDTLAAMETALAAQPFLLGARPTAADFGFFGSMFRHFFSDPTPASIMRATAPRTLEWVARLWALTPASVTGADAPEIPAASAGLLKIAAQTHLPYLTANARAFANGEPRVEFEDRGAKFQTPANPYHAWCLDQLIAEYETLAPADAARVDALLGDGAKHLKQPRIAGVAAIAPTLPIRAGTPAPVKSRAWV